MTWLILLFHIVLSIVEASDGQKVAKPGCPEKCGDVVIPFGISPECSHSSGFELLCNSSSNGTMVPFYNYREVQSIMLSTAQARIYNYMSWQCYQNSTGPPEFSITYLTLINSVYRLSHLHNVFVVVGCDTLAFSDMWK
jgi:hypothetical protein